MHVHTLKGAADSSLSPQQLTDEARRIGLTGVNLSEHDRVWEQRDIDEFRRESGLFVSRGMEVSTDHGHIIAIGLDRYYPGIRYAEELSRIARDTGAFLIAAHPFRHFFYASRRGNDRRLPADITPEEAVEKMPILTLVDEMEVANGGNNDLENQFALRVAPLVGMRGIGASDCHSINGVGCCATVFEEELRDQTHMLELLRAKRFYAAVGLNVGEFRPYVQAPLPVPEY